MDLSNRQLFILSYLLNQPQGISGEHLASQVGVSMRTLQNEVRQINTILPGGASIESLGKKGYCVSGFTDRLRKELFSNADDRQSLYMPEERVNDVFTVLLFTRGYTSMEAVAEQLYVSKGTVFRTIESNYALRKAVTISRTRGITIDLPEFDKRQLLTKVFDKDSTNPYAQSLKQEYTQLDGILRTILVNLFKRHRYSVSGEALRGFRRYLIISILRSRHGFPLENVDHNLPISSLMTDIMNTIYTLMGIRFSEAEQQDIQAKLNHLNTYLRDVPEHRMRWIPEWETQYDAFFRELQECFGLDITLSAEEKQRFLLHVYKLHERVVVGHHNSNYHKREINRSHPLATHLIVLCFEKCFGFPVPEAEVTFLAMYLAMKMRQHLQRIDCIIVTAKHPSVAWPMKTWMEEHFSRHLKSVEIVEHYRFTPAMVRPDILILTTGESVVLSCPQAILVKPFALEEEFEVIDQWIQEIRHNNRMAIFAASCADYHCHKERLEVGGKTFYGILADLGESYVPADTYEFVLDTDAFLLPRVHRSAGENRITVYRFSKPVLHRGMELRHLIVSDYHTENQDMKRFYMCLIELMKPGRLDEIF